MKFHKIIFSMQWVGLVLGAVALALLFPSCQSTESDGHTYLSIKVDTAWYHLDSIQVLLDKGNGATPIVILSKKITKLDDLNHVQADGYNGGKVTIIIKGFIANKLTAQINKEYDGATGKSIEVIVKVTLPDTTKVPIDTTKIPIDTTKVPVDTTKIPVDTAKVPVDTTKVPVDTAKVPVDTVKDVLRLSVTPTDTVISVRDSLVFMGNAGNATGKLTQYRLDWNGDGRSDDSGSLNLDSTTLKFGFRFIAQGVYSPTWTIKGNKGGTLTRSVKVSVVLDKPTAYAGKDTTVLIGDSISFTGIGKDSLGTLVKQEWKVGDGAFASTPNGKVVFQAPASAGDVMALFRVTDDDSLTAVDTVIVHVVSPTVANLTELTMVGCSLSPIFNPDSLSYACTASYGSSAVSLTAKALGSIAVNGMGLENGKPSIAIALVNGKTVLTLVVTNGSSIKTYGVSVVSLAASSDNSLKSLALSAGKLVPGFSSSTLNYDVTVGNSDSTLAFTATVADSTASILLNGIVLPSGKISAGLSLTSGAKTQFAIKVTAQNGDIRTYAIQVSRLSGNAALKSLAITPGSLLPAFSSDILNYAMTFAYTTADITVLAVPQDSGRASMVLNTVALEANKASALIPLSVGKNSLTLLVTAEDVSFKRTYQVEITRLAEPLPSLPKVTNAFLITPDRPTWSWVAGGGGNGSFRYKLDDSILTTGATVIVDTFFTPLSDLPSGVHTLYVQERNSSGSWSAIGRASASIALLKPIADFTLAGHASDTTLTQSDLGLYNVPYLTQGVYVNGVYGGATGSSIQTPNLTGFDSTNFTIEVDFKPEALPASSIPVLVGGTSYRWLGMKLDPDGRFSLLYNNALSVQGTLTYSAAEWQTAKITYASGIVRLYLNNIQSATVTAVIQFGRNLNITSSNPSVGNAFKGNLRNLRIYSGTNKIGQYPLSGDSTDIVHQQRPIQLTNTPFQIPTPGVTCAGVYSTNLVSTGQLKQLNFSEFSISANFTIAAAPPVTIPIFVGGDSYRWLGAQVDPSGNLVLLYNNSLLVTTTTKITLNTPHKVLIRFGSAAQMAAIYLDGELAGIKAIPTLNTSTDKSLSNTNYASGTTFKGTLSRLTVLSQ